MTKSTIKLISNHATTEELTKTYERYIIPSLHNFEFVSRNPDYYAIINHPFLNINNKITKQYYDVKNTLYFHNEPYSSRKQWSSWFEPESDKFMYNHKMNIKMFDFDCSSKYDLETFYNKPIPKYKNKKNHISCVTTDLYFLPGHKLRVNFLKDFESLSNHNIMPEIYGKKVTGIYDKLNLQYYKGPVGRRIDVIESYYYNFMAENVQEDDYFTEKIMDPILSKTLCFYWGCPNLKNYIHEKSYINVDLTRPKLAVQIIKDAMLNDEHSKRLKYINESRKKIIFELSPATIINNIINKK